MTITAELSDAFFSSKYVVICGQEEIKLPASGSSDGLRKLLQKHNVNSCAFITAYNPESIDTDTETNETNQNRLLSEVLKKNWEHYKGHGVDYKEQRQPEPSLLILGISLEEARKLSHQFHQSAFLFGSVTGRTNLIATNPDEQPVLDLNLKKLPHSEGLSFMPQQNEPKNYLLEASKKYEEKLRNSGYTVKEMEPSRTAGLQVSFVPAKRESTPMTATPQDALAVEAKKTRPKPS